MVSLSSSGVYSVYGVYCVYDVYGVYGVYNVYGIVVGMQSVLYSNICGSIARKVVYRAMHAWISLHKSLEQVTWLLRSCDFTGKFEMGAIFDDRQKFE